MKNKAQTAMEYLMTYGWAILIIIVVVAALYSLGVFSVKPSVACSPCFSYFAFRDYDKTGTATCTAGGLYIRNGARTIDTLSSDVGSTSDCPTGSPCDPGQDITICGIPLTGEQTITLTYTDVDTTVVHTDIAKIHN